MLEDSTPFNRPIVPSKIVPYDPDVSESKRASLSQEPQNPIRTNPEFAPFSADFTPDMAPADFRTSRELGTLVPIACDRPMIGDDCGDPAATDLADDAIQNPISDEFPGIAPRSNSNTLSQPADLREANQVAKSIGIEDESTDLTNESPKLVADSAVLTETVGDLKLRATIPSSSSKPRSSYKAKNPETGKITVGSYAAEHPTNAWRHRAQELAEWTENFLINRWDASGSYRSFESRARNPDKGPSYTNKHPLTRDRIVAHYVGYDVGRLIGLHTTHNDLERRSWSRWGVVDIDCHDDSVDRQKNLFFALYLYDRAIARGIQPILEDSNGKGGFHLWIIFDAPIETARVYDLMISLTRDWKACGLTYEPELYPKQRQLRTSFGNWLRLPGRHHTRLHWSRIWDGREWFVGNQAIDILLTTPKTSPAQIPGDCAGSNLNDARDRSHVIGKASRDTLSRLAEEALDYLGEMAISYDSWLRIGMSLSPLGDEGLRLWTQWSEQVPEKFSASECAEKWQTFSSGQPGDAGLGTLFYLARQAGWQKPWGMPIDIVHTMAKIDHYLVTRDPAGLYHDAALMEDLAQLKSEGSPELPSIRAKIKNSRNAGFLIQEFQDQVSAASKKLKQSRMSRGGNTEGSRIAPEIGKSVTAQETPKITIPSPKYFDDGYQILATISVGDQPTTRLISGFSARILESITRDDGGSSPTKTFLIRAVASRGQRPRIAEIAAADFTKMDWPIPAFGPDYIIQTGYKDHVRVAIQELSCDRVERTVYTHTGWRRIDGRWCYLHAGGSITSQGNDQSLSVEIDRLGISNYRLPSPPEGQRLVAAMLASLKMLALAEDNRPGSRAVAAVLFSSTYRAAIQYANFAIQAYGFTGSLKTSTFALAQQHFGAAMDLNALPLSWASDTPLAIGEKLTRIWDAVALIDDLVFRGSNQEISRKQSEAQLLIQQIGNHTGRQRLNQDGSPKPSRPPNCLAISTGEDRVHGGSADARTLPIRFSLGMIDKAKLKLCQSDAANGLYAEAMAGFLRWLAPQLDEIRAEMAHRVSTMRDELFQEGDHGRTPEILAHLIFGAETALRFALEIRAIDPNEHNALLVEIKAGLAEAAGEVRADRADDPTPCQRFIELVKSSLLSGHGYIGKRENDEVPEGIEALCGWRQVSRSRGYGEIILAWERASNAERIGWADSSYVYLHPEISFIVARRVAEAGGQGFAITRRSLTQMLWEAELIESPRSRNPCSSEADSKTTQTSRYLSRVYIGTEKKQVSVLKFPASSFWGVEN